MVRIKIPKSNGFKRIEFFLSESFAWEAHPSAKKVINILLFLTDAALRAPGSPPFEPIDIPTGSHVYVQLPGTVVLAGILQIEENYVGSVYVRNYNGVSLTANLEHFGHTSTHTNHEYRCYVLLPNRRVLATFLRPFNPERESPGIMKIVVQVPGNCLLAGVLERGRGYRPEWLPREI